MLILAACSAGEKVTPTGPTAPAVPTTPTAASVTINAPATTLANGQALVFTATPKDSTGAPLAGRSAVWASSDPTVIVVSYFSGLSSDSAAVTAVGRGSATISATVDGKNAAATVTVIAPPVFAPATISAGWSTACGLSSSGAASCWGQNAGSLIHGLQLTAWTPIALAGGLTFTALTVGTYHACGLTANGAAFCWGNNDAGQLGDGTTLGASNPVAVAGGLTFAAVSAGVQHTCGLTAGGAAYCWGFDGDGELGDRNTTFRRITPTPVAGGLSFAAVSAGTYHTCGLTAAGAAYCWGAVNGTLADGTTIGTPTPVPVAGGLAFRMLSAGDGFTCGIVASGAAYCWGENNPAAPSTDSSITTLMPVALTGGLQFTSVSASPGNFNLLNTYELSPHACGLTTSGAAYCWGDNQFGELGDGVWTFGIDNYSFAPTAVAGGLSFTSVSAGGGYSCGRTTTGAVYCWGLGNSGQLGNGAYTSSLTPVRVGGAP